MLLTGEFVSFVGIPVLLLFAARNIPVTLFGSNAEIVSLGLTGIAVGWLILGLLRISRYGPSSGIGCYLLEPDGQLGALVGGVRMRLERRHRRLWIAGLLVEPKWRSMGIGTALMLGAFRIAQEEALRKPVVVSVFAPSHPASKAIIAKQLGGLQSLEVATPPSKALLCILDNLESALRQSNANFQWQVSSPEHNLFGGAR